MEYGKQAVLVFRITQCFRHAVAKLHAAHSSYMLRHAASQHIWHSTSSIVSELCWSTLADTGHWVPHQLTVEFAVEQNFAGVCFSGCSYI